MMKFSTMIHALAAVGVCCGSLPQAMSAQAQQMNMQAIVQFGVRPVTVTQNAPINGVGILQVGGSPSASVIQSGSNNYTGILQFGGGGVATIGQTGASNFAFVGQSTPPGSLQSIWGLQ